MMIDPERMSDYLLCKSIIDAHSKTFSLAFSKLPSPKKEAVWALYAFNRQLDDFVDEHQDLEGLLDYQDKFNRLWDGDVHEDPILRALYDVMQHFNLRKDAFNKMFQGQINDCDFKPIQTTQALLDYCELVAGSVGEMLLPILSSRIDETLVESAIALGNGMQITNILRDVYEDYQRNRIYLPRDLLEAYHVNLELEVKDGPTPQYIALWEHLAHIAEDQYELGLSLINQYDKDSQYVVRASAIMYKGILDAVRKQKYRLDKRASLSKKEKLLLAKELLLK